MDTVTLPGEIVSTRIGFGCAGLMREPSAARRQQLLGAAFEQGIRHFDVARMYGLGAAERELGRFARAARREQLVIATKFGIEAAGAPGRLARLQAPARSLLARSPALRARVKARAQAFHRPHCYDVASARASLEHSLRELNSDHVDVFFVHGPTGADTIDFAELGAFLEQARTAGRIRAWGVAGECEPSLQVSCSLPAPAVLQLGDDIFSPALPLGEDAPAPITFGVVAGALQRIRAHLLHTGERCADWSAQIGVDCAEDDALAQLLLRDALVRNPRGVVLAATTRPERLAGLAAQVVTARATQAGGDRALGALRALVLAEMASAVPAGGGRAADRS
jgi:D-threo-aldose 1-dehydrogenase